MQPTKAFLDKLQSEVLIQRLIKDKVFMIDSSEFGYWSNCFARGLFTGGVRRVSAGLQSALLFGGAVHKGLARHYKGGTLEEAIGDTRVEAVKTQLDMCLDEKRTTSKAVQMVESYIHHETVMGKPLLPLELNGVRMVEENFALPFGTISSTHFGIINVVWSGIIDLFVIDGNNLWIADHKTTSMMGEKFVDDKIRSNQVPGYVWVGRELTKFLDKSLDGAIINALCHRSGGFEFKRFKLPYQQWKIDEWRVQTLQRCQSIVEGIGDLFAGGTISVNREACVTKYGKCPFFEICDTLPLLRDKILFNDDFFKHNDWNPSGIES